MTGGFVATFLLGWMALDRLITSPPTILTTTLAITAAGGAVFVGHVVALGTPAREVPARLGLGRPRARALVVGTVAGALVVLTYVVGAAALDVDLELRRNWPVVAVNALLFHGFAEELVWRGFAFGHLRRRMTFWRAVLWVTPLIAVTHVPIIVGNGLLLGALAVLSAAVTCVPFAHLWEHGGRTIWGPAVLHGAIGFWQLFERTFPDRYSAAVICGSIVVPLVVLLWRPRP
jgi:membrane protease YdiL (CAAX protease family)